MPVSGYGPLGHHARFVHTTMTVIEMTTQCILNCPGARILHELASG
jgi:hypothetical protein